MNTRETPAPVVGSSANDLLSPDRIASAVDLERAIDNLRSGADYAATHVRDVMQVASLHAQAGQQRQSELDQRQTQAAEDAKKIFSHLQPADLPNYLIDVYQRWVLFMDVLRRRGNNFLRYESEGGKPVLAFEYDLVIDGATLEQPVNYSLVAIRHPAGVKPRENARPYIIIDPRAGHGSGIGGFKNESEVGVALHAGHPVYFCIFTTHPAPTQTPADVTRAEAQFVREVRKRHPDSPKPVIIGNCQGGWAAMLLAATNPDFTGPVVINGAPLSYWSGTRGKNPMRYLGGLSGGVVPALLLADLGNGEFDGANLVSNFENLNPGNSLWKKYYDVFANPEKEAARYLEFERWWSSFYFMNENEIRWIVENLFVGNRLARGGAQLDSRMHVDLRNIRAPVIVFASHGDNITPPAQALNWIADVYSSVKDIKARGQRIVYTVHDSVGHLGIFVSSAVANKEHKEIVSTLKAIESMAPGLYEMKIEDETGEGLNKRFTVDFAERSIEDVLALSQGRDDEAPFAAVARLSQLGAEFYNLAARPLVRALTNSATARLQRETQPLRVQRTLLSNRNPFMAPVAAAAESVRASRGDAAAANPFYLWEKTAADLITGWFDHARDMRDGMVETWFYAVYSSPLMRSLAATQPRRTSEVPGTDLRSVHEVVQALAQITRGDYAVGVIRMLILLAHARKSVRRDRLERSNELLTKEHPFDKLDAAARTRIIHQQSMIVDFEPDQALATLPRLILDAKDRARAIKQCEHVLGALEEMSDETRDMFDRIRKTLELAPTPGTAPRARSAA
jgi:pimeloyl-ACP methyl ester carboxylesterase/tellurite resistance protein